ncbi:transglutaminase family protein [Rhodobacteraceae bacterium 2376]|uniref:Transglutaminase family protein n=1 Tax=Rhabdonatronobacter sediminivivens TaxID=2743469 RepID=A0A7Z0KZ21_9RHOB|nr:transglutaminase family protein [Rhabdonatronobacter sediminivivens]
MQTICNDVHNHLTYGYGFGRSTKAASDTQREKTGVCRDFAHLAIALCRAKNIPARHASGYLGDIGVPDTGPGDFSAGFEVYLGDRWYTFDARYNTPGIGRVQMVRGRDAADGAMITLFGTYDLKVFRVWTDKVPGTPSEAQMTELLNVSPRRRGAHAGSIGLQAALRGPPRPVACCRGDDALCATFSTLQYHARSSWPQLGILAEGTRRSIASGAMSATLVKEPQHTVASRHGAQAQSSSDGKSSAARIDSIVASSIAGLALAPSTSARSVERSSAEICSVVSIRTRTSS